MISEPCSLSLLLFTLVLLLLSDQALWALFLLKFSVSFTAAFASPLVCSKEIYNSEFVAVQHYHHRELLNCRVSHLHWWDLILYVKLMVVFGCSGYWEVKRTSGIWAISACGRKLRESLWRYGPSAAADWIGGDYQIQADIRWWFL